MSPTPKKIRSQPPDVIVAVGKGDVMKEYECYKIVLSFASPFFDAMLSADMAEKNTGRIELPEKDPEDWEIFSKFIDPSLIGDVDHCGKIDKDIAMKMTPWFHEFQMDSCLKKCDEVLSEKIVYLSKKQKNGGERYDKSFWDLQSSRYAYVQHFHEPLTAERKENFGNIIEMLQFACLYNLGKTQSEAETAIKYLAASLLPETIDLFTIDHIKSLVELSLPLLNSMLCQRQTTITHWHDRMNDERSQVLSLFASALDFFFAFCFSLLASSLAFFFFIIWPINSGVMRSY